MAEVAIAGTFPPRGTGLVCDVVDREVLERHRVAKPVDVVDRADEAFRGAAAAAARRAVPGLEMMVVHPDTLRGVARASRRGAVVARYFGDPRVLQATRATAALFRDGWLCTGDLAYLLDGELVLCGRIKDVIIVGGRNVFPEDIERAVGGLDGVRAGNVIAFGVDGYKGKESVVVVAEVRTDEPPADIRAAIHERTLDVCGLPPRDVMLVQAGQLAQDIIRQAPTCQVPRAVPRRGLGSR